jgi:DNA-directed RNA polymerase III subunit RPC8
LNLKSHILTIFSDVNEQLWVWIWEGNELYMDIDEKIRFRVVDGIFSDVKAAASQRQRNLPNSEEPVDAVLSTTKTPHYSIIVSM